MSDKVRSITLVQLGPGGGYLEEYPQPIDRTFHSCAHIAKHLLMKRASDPLCAAIGHYINGEFMGKWVLTPTVPSGFTFIPSEVYDEVS